MAAADELQARVNFSTLSFGQDTCTPAPAQDDHSRSPLAATKMSPPATASTAPPPLPETVCCLSVRTLTST